MAAGEMKKGSFLWAIFTYISLGLFATYSQLYDPCVERSRVDVATRLSLQAAEVSVILAVILLFYKLIRVATGKEKMKTAPLLWHVFFLSLLFCAVLAWIGLKSMHLCPVPGFLK